MGAMGIDSDVAKKFVRLSFDLQTTEREVEQFLLIVEASLEKAATV
jgi:cysteine sulfinate desulfinase/cysteine desulfurase-like protein